MIEEGIFDFVAVSNEESREIGYLSNCAVNIAGFEKGEHCRRVVVVV
jgi:hypothetical protein